MWMLVRARVILLVTILFIIVLAYMYPSYLRAGSIAFLICVVIFNILPSKNTIDILLLSSRMRKSRTLWTYLEDGRFYRLKTEKNGSDVFVLPFWMSEEFAEDCRDDFAGAELRKFDIVILFSQLIPKLSIDDSDYIAFSPQSSGELNISYQILRFYKNDLLMLSLFGEDLTREIRESGG